MDSREADQKIRSKKKLGALRGGSFRAVAGSTKRAGYRAAAIVALALMCAGANK